MQADDHVCLCFHVSKRKIVNFCLRERPEHASQVSDCLSAGTGCGWCIPFLKALHSQVQAGKPEPDLPVSPEEYANRRATYRGSGQPKNTFQPPRYHGLAMKPQALILRAAGTNCDRELAHAFELAGASSVTIHLNHLIEDPKPLEQADLIGFPGGFSYGDDIAAGRIFANRLRHKLLDPLRAAIARGVPIIGVCNGFQVLVKLGLLPDPAAAPRQTVTLADNTSGRFIDQWVSLTPAADSVCIWTRGLPVTFDVPIAHGEGRFVPANDQVLADLHQRHQIALRYATNSGADPGAGANFPGNPNGSVDDIAGICDPSGLVLGLMPHPERHAHATQHPHWTRRPAEEIANLSQTPAGLQFFVNAVEHVKASTPQAVAPAPL